MGFIFMGANFMPSMCDAFQFTFIPSCSCLKSFMLLYFVVNSWYRQMGAVTTKYSKGRCDEIVKEVSSYLKKVGHLTLRRSLLFPSPVLRDSMIERSTNVYWYKGPTLLEALDMIQEPERPSDKPLRLPLPDFYEIGGIGTVPVGCVEAGILKPGMVVTSGPSGLNRE